MSESLPTAEKDAPCTHPYWTEEGDGHGHNSWRCTTCGHSQWVAPWVMNPRPAADAITQARTALARKHEETTNGR